MEIVLNTYYNTTSAARRQGVIVHEFGHSFGLAHENATYSGCAGGSVGYLAIMYSGDSRFSGNCAVFTPQTDDVSGINALY